AGPASSSRAVRAGSWLRRAARTEPAEPPPTMTTSAVPGRSDIRICLRLQVAGSALGTTGGSSRSPITTIEVKRLILVTRRMICDRAVGQTQAGRQAGD